MQLFLVYGLTRLTLLQIQDCFVCFGVSWITDWNIKYTLCALSGCLSFIPLIKEAVWNFWVLFVYSSCIVFAELMAHTTHVVLELRL